jgi:hypothetical protein
MSFNLKLSSFVATLCSQITGNQNYLSTRAYFFTVDLSSYRWKTTFIMKFQAKYKAKMRWPRVSYVRLVWRNNFNDKGTVI